MAEGLGMVLTGLALATALKDAIEIWDKIEASFNRVSQNMQRAQRLAGETRMALDQLKQFHDEHGANLDTSAEVKNALNNLTTKMESVYSACSHLIPATSDTGFGRYVLKYHAWRNGRRIEDEMRELRKDIENCYTLFTMFASMRTEVTLLQFQKVNSAKLDALMDAIPSLTITDKPIYAVSHPRSTVSRPPLVEKETLNDMYLRSEVETVVKLALQMPEWSTRGSNGKKTAMSASSCTPLLPSYASEEKHSLRANVVRIVLDIKDLLSPGSTSPSLDMPANLMNNLTLRLCALDMFKEAADIQNCTIAFYQILSDSDADGYTPHLVYNLRVLADVYVSLEDLERAYEAIGVSVEISRRHRSTSRSPKSRIQLAEVLSRKAQIMLRNGVTTQLLETAKHAVKIYQRAMQIEGPYQWEDRLLDFDSDSRATLWEATRIHESHNTLREYAMSLVVLAEVYQYFGRVQEDIETKRKALEILRDIVILNSDASVDLDIAGILSGLATDAYEPFIPRERSLLYVEQCVVIYRKYVNMHPIKYGRNLCDALQRKATILWDVSRRHQAIECWTITAELGRKFVDDQIYIRNIIWTFGARLSDVGRHNDAAAMYEECLLFHTESDTGTSMVQASIYLNLSGNLRLSGRYKEAVQAAGNAVARYRMIAFQDPDMTTKLAIAMNSLTETLLHAGYLEQAIHAGDEALTIYRRLTVNDPLLLDSYVKNLWLNMFIDEITDNQKQSIQRSEDIVHQFRVLSERHSSEVGFEVALARRTLARNLARFGRLSEAKKILGNVLRDWRSACSSVDATRANCEYMWCLILYSDILADESSTHQALKLLTRAIKIGASSKNCRSSMESAIAYAISRNIFRLCHLGRYTEALESIDEYMPIKYRRTLDADSIVCCLQASAHANLHNSKSKEAVELAKEALSICQGSEMITIIQEYPYVLQQLPECLRYLSMGLAELGEAAKAKKYATRAVEKLLQLKTHPLISWLLIEPIYMANRQNLAMCLIANRELSEAITILTDLRPYYTARARTRRIAYVELASVLQTISILDCALGRHEQGAAAENELFELRKNLDVAFPNLGHQIDLRLIYDMKRASAAVLQETKSHLECDHKNHL